MAPKVGNTERGFQHKTGTLGLVQARAADTAACALKTDPAQPIAPVVFPQRLVYEAGHSFILFCFFALAGCFVFVFCFFLLCPDWRSTQPLEKGF